MTDKELFEQLGTLEDVQFYGCIWKETDFHISLDGHNFNGIICHWAYELVMNLSWQSKSHKVGGPLLSMSGQLARLNDSELKFLLDFGNDSYISLICSDITVLN